MSQAGSVSGGGGGGGGNVVGPASSVDNDIVIFDGVTGKVIKDTGISSLAPSFVGDVSTGGDFNLPATTASTGKLTIAGVDFLSNGGDASNTFLGGNAGNTTNTASQCTGIGQDALNDITTAVFNTAVGSSSMNSLVSGGGNTALGYASMSSCGASVGGNTAIGSTVLTGTSANFNTAIGFACMSQGAVSGNQNVGVGVSTLLSLSAGNDNIALGYLALQSITSGSSNVSIGTVSGSGINTGSGNTAVGHDSFNNAIGTGSASNNCFFGVSAGSNIENATGNSCFGSASLLSGQGSYNSCFGFNSGINYNANESSNICIANLGVASDNNTLRIGTQGNGDNQVDTTFIAGIFGVTVPASSPVVIDANGQMGTIVSSARFKENIKDLESEAVLNLRPVTFNYISDSTKENSVGLIAEEVHKVLPNLVILDAENNPYTVKYEQLCIYLLSEVKKLSEKVIELEKRIA